MHPSYLACLIATGLAFGSNCVFAANADFQDFFADVCAGAGAPTGILASRCAETGSGTGDGNLSGDSESSLNPSQSLSNSDTALSIARSRGKESRERAERLRDGGDVLQGGDSFGPFSLLAHGRGQWFETSFPAGGDPERGYDGDLWAVELGLDYRLTDRFVIGAILAFEEMNADFDRDLQEGAPFVPASSAGSMESESYAITFFGAYSPGDHFYIDGSFGYRGSEYDFQRNSVFQESGRSSQTSVIVRGRPDGAEYWGSLNFGYDFQNGAFAFGPYAGITFANSDIDAYAEEDLNASGLNMVIDSPERDALLGHVGLRASYALSTGNGVWVPQLRVEWNRDFEDQRAESVSTYVLDAGATAYGLAGVEPDTDFYNIGLGVAGVLPGGWLPFLDYEVLLGHRYYDRQRITFGLRKEF